MVFLYALVAYSFSFAQLRVEQLTCENRVNPVGIDQARPRFGWQLVADRRGVMQSAYEITVRSGTQVVWSSGKHNSGQSHYISYAGKPLYSGAPYTWQVRVWDNAGTASGWSSPATFQMGILQAADWKAQWMEAGFEEDSVNRPAQYFRKGFMLKKPIRSATAYITAHGMYEAYLNGQRVGDQYLSPGWTSYEKRLPYQVFDITSLLSRGQNAIGVVVGNGWYRGFLAWDNHKNIYGSKLGVWAQLEITYTDGSKEWVVSGDTWKSAAGPIRYAEIYHGETIDARKSLDGWDTPGYNDGAWSGTVTATYPLQNLVATENEPIRKQETFTPVKIFRTPKGEQVIDFGQNLVGWVKVRVRGQAGDQVVIKHAEVLDKQGNFYTENLRAARATATYILRGSGVEVFEPHFTFYGFRYIKVEGYNGELQPEDFTAIALYSDMPKTGQFTSSHPLLNQLQHNIEWGQRGNFLDVPTDCPQRDERLGWTGDAQAFSRTAAFNFGVQNFFSKWLKDVAADQLPNGSIPFVVPNVLGAGASGSTGWADVANIIPWNMYLSYGDTAVLRNQYASMKAWVGYMEQQSRDDLWNTGFHFGDWLFYRPFDDNDGRSAVTDKYLIAQCFFAHSTQLLLNAAKVLNKPEEVSYYTTLLGKVKAAFLREYLTPNGRLVSGTQTAYVLALNFDMLPENLRAQAADRLEENIKSYGNHLSTGFLGTPYLCHVLSRFGKLEMAYNLLLQESYPSWLYPVKMGATTIWERWNGIRTDSSFEPASMNSFNHYAYGAIGDWMYRVVAGLDTYEDGPGYKQIKIEPHPGKGLTHASATLQTLYGTASSQWNTQDGQLEVQVTIPANARGMVFLPVGDAGKVKEGGQPVAGRSDIQTVDLENGKVRLGIGSGTYRFVVDIR